MKTNHAPFSTQTWDQIRSSLDRAQRASPGPWIAAFDADGTLWDTDVGEDFFHYQIKNSNLLGLPADPWNHYMEWKKKDRLAAYLWLAQINKGQKVENVLSWAQRAIETNPEFRVFESQRQLIKELLSRGIEVFVISASVEWAVVPPAVALGVPRKNVIGVRTTVTDGVVTDKGEFPVTWGPGKPEALVNVARRKELVLASGNTIGDAPLLRCSSGVKLAVRSNSNTEGPLWQSEVDLFEAAEKDWITHIF